MTKKFLLFFSLLFSCTPLLAQESESIADSSTIDDFQRFTALPVLGYSEETELQYGAMAIIFLKPSFKGGQTGELDLTVYGTTKKQLTAMVSPQFFLFHDKVDGFVDFYYRNWTSNFFGVGNDPDMDSFRPYDLTSFYADGILQTSFLLPQVLSKAKYGLSYHFEKSKISFKDYEGEIAEPGDVDGLRNGIGYRVAWDSRDNTNWARHGFLASWQHDFYNKALGDFSYTRQSLDLRGYSEFIWNTSMAVGFLWQRVDGNVPFDKLVGPDGIKRFRGVEVNYFSGNQGLFLQTEFRKQLFWRLAGSIFFEGGKTGEYFSDLWRNKWHHGVGFGGQFALNTSERLYARGDVSLIDFKDIGLTVYIREAF